MHPDHVGLAAWLCERWNAPLWMTMTDYAIARLWSQRAPDAGVQGGGAGGQGAVDHFARHGWRDAAAQEQIRQRAGYYPDLVPAMPPRFPRLLDGPKVSDRKSFVSGKSVYGRVSIVGCRILKNTKITENT